MKIRLHHLLPGLLPIIGLISFESSGQQTFPRNGAYDERPAVYAFTNATIQTDPENKVINATLLITNGYITAVGKNIAIPEEAVVYDCRNKHIYPSFVDLQSSYGLPEIKTPATGGGRPIPQLESNKKGAFAWNQALNTEQNASRIFAVDKDKAAELRAAGLGTVLTHYPDGIARGTGALTTLASLPTSLVVLKSDASVHFSFSKGSSTQNYPNSIMGAVALLRQFYYDADWYAKGGSKQEQNLSLSIFNTTRSLPSFFEANDKWSLLRADQIGDEFGIQYIIKGGGDEYQRIDEIKASKASLIVPVNFPEAYDVTDPWDAEVLTLAEMKHWEAAPGNLYALENAGIPFAITVSGLKKPAELMPALRKAMAYGLSEKKALEALTIAPARIIQAENLVGKLQKGLIANFLITSGNVFEEESIILENWIQGNRYVLSESVLTNLKGEYSLSVDNSEVGKLVVKGSDSKPSYTLTLRDSSSVSPVVRVDRELINIAYQTKQEEGLTRLTGWIENDTLIGSGKLANGKQINWKAIRALPYTPAPMEVDSTKEKKQVPPVVYPFVGLGLQKLPDAQQSILFKGATVWALEGPENLLPETDVLVQNGKIARIGKNISAPSDTKVIEAQGFHLTPGLIDEHSHIALFGVNEGSQSSSAEVRMKDAINPEDVNIYRQLAGGVTTSQLLHGSANAIGGQSAVIKLKWGEAPEKLLIPEAKHIKFALGENVKQSNWGDLVRLRYPQTRMGVEQIYYDHFIRAREYHDHWKAYNGMKNKNGINPPRRDLELDALAEILQGERNITCHSYVQSEINMLMRVADSLGFRINTFTHILEGYKLADKMAHRKIGGSAFADWWAYKMEVKEAIPYNAALMSREGVTVAINSDDAEMARRLNHESAKTITFGGVSETEALKMITLNPARLLHLDHRIGSIRVGKDADLVLWNEHPLSVYARPEYTVIEGAIYFSKEDDAKRQEDIAAERARLIRKSVDAKSAGATVRAPQSSRPRMWHCEDILGEHAEHADHDHH